LEAFSRTPGAIFIELRIRNPPTVPRVYSVTEEQAATAAAEQAERNAGARRELARAAGMAIYGVTALLQGGSTFDKAAAPIDIVLVTFAARGRRLLHAAFRLIDAGEESEAAPLLRVLHEYVIVTTWLLLDPDKHAPGWAIDDLTQRAVAAEKTAEDKDLDAETRKTIAAIGKDARSQLTKVKEQMGDEAIEPPPLEQMAKQAGLGFPYSFAYRLQSQSDVHATALAIDKTLEQTSEGLVLRDKPGLGLGEFDSYQIAAHLLLDLVRPLSEKWPALEWTATLDAVDATLTAIARADPASETSKRRQSGE
jgi:hypothetical protein